MASGSFCASCSDLGSVVPLSLTVLYAEIEGLAPSDVTVYDCCITSWTYLLCICVIWVSSVAALYYSQWYFSSSLKKTGWAFFFFQSCLLYFILAMWNLCYWWDWSTADGLLDVFGIEICWIISFYTWVNIPGQADLTVGIQCNHSLIGWSFFLYIVHLSAACGSVGFCIGSALWPPVSVPFTSTPANVCNVADNKCTCTSHADWHAPQRKMYCMYIDSQFCAAFGF